MKLYWEQTQSPFQQGMIDIYKNRKILQIKVGAKIMIIQGENDILIATSKHDVGLKPDFKVDDPSLEGLIIRLKYKLGSYFLLAEGTALGNTVIDPYKVPSAYYLMNQGERHILQPGDVIKMGLISFAVERFNTGVVAEVGNRPSMEDTYIIVQDLMIDECMKASLYAVLDGHGGDSCAHYMRKRLANEIRI